MKVEISNLGVIKKAEIDLKPLTVFIGQNGEGKSWTAYTIAAILGGYGFEEYVEAYIEGKTQQKYPLLDEAIEQLMEEGGSKIDMVKFASDYAEIYFNDIASWGPKLMRNFLKSRRLSFKDLQISVSLAESKSKSIETIKAGLAISSISSPQSEFPLLNAVKESEENTLYFYSSGDALDKLPKRSFKQFVTYVVFKTIQKSLFTDTYFFPTERTTFISFPFGDFDKIKITMPEIREKSDRIDSISQKAILIEPVQQLLKTISMAHQDNLYEEREEQIKENPSIGDYLKLADFLESEILQGKLKIEKAIEKELLFQPIEEDIKLEMPVVSSMVKELAPLVLYLRYLAEPNDLLIIDEPEMNLHPSVQVEIVEFLGMLVNAGLNVIITTHSTYIVDQLINLMKTEKHEDKEKIKEWFYLEKSEAFISKDRVSVYLFEEGTAKNILRKDAMIDWDTFSNVSEDVSELYSQLLVVEN